MEIYIIYTAGDINHYVSFVTYIVSIVKKSGERDATLSYIRRCVFRKSIVFIRNVSQRNTLRIHLIK